MGKILQSNTGKVALSLFMISNLLVFFSCKFVSAETLKQTLITAHKNSKSLCADQASVRAFYEDVFLARSKYMPIISIHGQYDRSNNSMRYSTVGSVGIQLEYKIFDGFITKNSLASAKANARAQQEFLRNNEQNFLLEVVKAYTELFAARQILILRQENLSALKAQVQAARTRLQVGEGTQTDIAQAEAEFSRAMSLLHQANADVKTREAVYRRVVGVESGVLEKPKSQINDNDIPKRLEDNLLHYVLQNHPAVLYAQYVAESADYTVKVQKGAYLPQVIAKAETAYSENYRSPGINEQSSSVNLQLSIPIFQGGAISARVRQSQELAAQARVEVAIKQDQVREQLVSSWSQLQGILSTVKAYRDSIHASKIALDGRIQENLVGQATTLDVLNSRTMVIDSQIDLILAERDALIASYAIKVATGQLSIANLR